MSTTNPGTQGARQVFGVVSLDGFSKSITYIPVAQGAAGTTVLATASTGNKHKIVVAILTMSATGTLKFTDSSGDLTGAMDISITAGFVAPGSIVPYTETGTTSALNLVTTVGAAKGVVGIITEV